MAATKKRTSSREKTKSKKTVAAKASVKSAGAVSKFELLRRFHLFSAAASFLIAVAAAFLLTTQTISVTSTHSAKDPIASSGGETVLGTAYESLFSVEIRYVVAALFGVFAVLSLLLATKLRARYEAGVKNATSFWRWLFSGVALGLMLEVVSALAGVQDIITLKLVVGLVLTTTLLGYLAERNNKGANSPKWVAYDLSLFTGFLAWLPAAAAIIGTHLYGLESYGWHVYALALIVLAVGVRFAIAQYNFVKYPRQHKDYVLTEEKYLSGELFTKLAFAAIVFVALIG